MATIIDAFLVTLGLDPKDFDKAVKQVLADQEKLRKESKKTAEEMQSEGEKAAQFYQKLLVGAGQLFAFFAAGNSLKGFIKDEQQAEISTIHLAQRLHMSVEKLGAWQNAFTIAGGSAEGLNKALMTLNTGFNRLGSRRDPLTMLTAIGERMRMMHDVAAYNYGASLGLDEATVRVLRENGEQLTKLVAEGQALGAVTKEQAQASIDLDLAQRRIELSGKDIGRTIMHMLLPAIKMFADALKVVSDWARAHPEAIKAAFMGIAAAILVVGAAGLKATLMMLPISLVILAIAAAVGILAAGVTYLYQEWKKWTSGGKTWLADFFGFVTKVWEKIKNYVLTHVYTIWYTIKDFITAVAGYFQLLWGLFTLDGDMISKGWEKLTTALGRIMKRLFNYILYELGYFISTMVEAWDNAWTRMQEKARKTLQAVADWWRDLNPGMKAVLLANPVTGGAAMIATMIPSSVTSNDSLRPLMTAHGRTGDRSNSVVIQEMNVNAPEAKDAQGIAQGMGDALRNEDLIAALDTGA